MFYQIEVNRIAHTGTNASYGDTVALIKDKKLALAFGRKYSGTLNAINVVVHVSSTASSTYFRNGQECLWHGRYFEPTPVKKKRTDMKALHESATKHGGCGRRTDRELAQLRRSSNTGSDLLWRVANEQRRRGLLKTSNDLCGMGYPAEIAKRISDYPEDQKSPRIS